MVIVFFRINWFKYIVILYIHVWYVGCGTCVKHQANTHHYRGVMSTCTYNQSSVHMHTSLGTSPFCCVGGWPPHYSCTPAIDDCVVSLLCVKHTFLYNATWNIILLRGYKLIIWYTDNNAMYACCSDFDYINMLMYNYI